MATYALMMASQKRKVGYFMKDVSQKLKPYLEELTKDLNAQKETLYLSFQELKYHTDDWKRINHCNAFFSNSLYYDDKPFVLVKSYNTIVAIYFPSDNLLVTLGRFTMTTYQHIRKFKNSHTKQLYKTNEINLELVNWFK